MKKCSWNAFHDDIDEQLIYTTADLLVETGLAAAGYVYLNIDGLSRPSLLLKSCDPGFNPA